MSEAPSEMVDVDRVRRLMRRGFQMCIERGVSPEDAAIAAIFVCFDLAESLSHAGAGQGAVEWMRTGCDMIERSIQSGAGRQPE